METFFAAIVQGILLGGVYSILALGIVVVCKANKIVNLAYGEIAMLMAYFTWFFIISIALPTWVGIILVFLVSILLSLGIDRIMIRPLAGQSFWTIVMATLFLGIAIVNVVVLIWGGRLQTIPGFLPSGTLSIGITEISYGLLSIFLAAIAMFLLFVLFFRYTRTGLAMKAIAEDSRISQSLGLSVKRITSLAWIISGIAAAVGGMLLGSWLTVEASLGMLVLSRALPIIHLGGLESIPGALLGGLIVGIAEMLAGTYIDPHVGGGFKDVMPFILIVVILIFKPYGFFGLKTIERI